MVDIEEDACCPLCDSKMILKDYKYKKMPYKIKYCLKCNQYDTSSIKKIKEFNKQFVKMKSMMNL